MDVSALCAYLNNYFVRKRYYGTFVISGGVLSSPEVSLMEGQYFRVMGSVFNDGVHKYPDSTMTDETFTGSVWAMAVPVEVLTTLDNINDWLSKYGEASNSPYSSESFAGYSYSKSNSGGSGSSSADKSTWQGVFSNTLNRWRRISALRQEVQDVIT